MQEIVLLSAARTPIGSFLGALASVPAPRLGATAVKAALERAQVTPDEVEQVLMGNVLQAGQGQAPARQAAVYAGLPTHVGAITVHKVCGSGMRAVMDAANAICANEWELAVAGGMESMSLAPHLLQDSRAGFRMGNVTVSDSMVHDGLWDPYGDKHMGMCAELCAKHYKWSRETQDEYALRSYKRAQAASEAGKFNAELAPVEVPQRRGESLRIDKDEEPFKAPLDKMSKLKPAFDPNGTVTAANASKINDGAAALVVSSASKAKLLGAKPLARIVAHGSAAHEPEWFTTAPAKAVEVALRRAGLNVGQVDRWEVNEAFAVVALTAIKDLDLDPERVNVRGGAVALGHPIGCSGARILATLLHTLVDEKVKYGCATACIGGGEATAVVLENLTL